VTRFVALGDSITLGIGDPVRTPGPPGGAGAAGRPGRRSWRGWAALLAEGLPEPELHNLAGNGARIADVERDQLPRALRLRPDVASVVAGVNDTLRPNFDPALIAAAVAHTVGALRAAGATVLTMRLPDPGQMLGVPGVLARPLARRAHEINLVMDAVAERFGTLHFDAAGDPEAYSPGMWAATGCTRASAATGSSPAGSTPCWPRPATRSGRRRNPSRATRRRPGATSWPGSPPRARPGCCGGPPTWYPACSRWRSGSGGMARTPIPPARSPRPRRGGHPRRPAATC
jgi:lysophospholipase L1-like esterase